MSRLSYLGIHMSRPTRRDYVSSIRGLRNFGLSCCVNALLQSISATEELLKLLDRWNPSGNYEERNNVPLLLRKTLHSMQGETPQPAPHCEFLDCLDRNSIPRNVQHDADEVFLSILNLILQKMTDTQLKEEILELYKVKVEGHVVCSECTFDHKVNSYMLSLPLPLQKGQNNLEDCIQTFFRQQELSGEDKCYCERCGEKQRSTQGFKLCSLPQILCIHLKRFRYEGGFTQKLHCKVTFPDTLNFSSILDPDCISDVFKKDDSPYSLYAVVVHSGTAMFGHYTAYIQPPGEQTWYYANDSRVRQVNWDKVQSSFGGQNDGDTAYMLLYRRQKTSEDQGYSV
ncbi:ubl carboxyl-terminal hydrolase 18 [Alosa sapidissima]|uniref:ubl carboxyl-terminal hydrolase 18 n=1 Tax=Alosa sapidissima TaxID=34773 RepID=UPI001C09B909|nr:ubl carboxyl-terminal hydrolase 18 [Alosa sapidissima]XP_041935247.1 ubl carboxyl-terminal hydrolase 18 [Alosa sapidissima]